MHKQAGFSLIELMIVLVIISIIASFAVPSYLGQIQKSKRSDALAALINVQMQQEMWRADNTTYTNDLAATGLNVNDTSVGGYYTLSVTNESASTYTINATADPTKGQISDEANGVSCKVLSINQSNVRIPPDCWSK